MKQTVQVGKPITKKGKIVGFEDVQTIASNKAFGYNRHGYKTLQPDDLKLVKKEPEKSDDDPDDLSKKTVKELKVIAEELGVGGKTKAVLIEAIAEAQAALAPDDD